MMSVPAGETAMAGPYVPRLIAWEVTRACMLACRHCRAAAQPAPDPDELSTRECFRLLDNVASFAKPILILTGGEPMLRSDIFDIASYATGLGLRVVMASCGAPIDDAAAVKIVRSGIRCLSISLDGATAETHDALRGVDGAFAQALRGIECARRAGLDFQVNTTVSRDNLDELPAILDLAARLGASVFNPFLLVPTGRARKLADRELSAEQYEKTLRWLAGQRNRGDVGIRVTCAPHFQRIVRQLDGRPGEGRAAKGCMGGQSFAFLSHLGKVQICGFLDVEAGDLREEDFDFRKIWDSSQLFAQVRDLRSYRGRCGYCEFAGVCGGCRARAYALTGDYLAEEPFCLHQPKRPDGPAAPKPSQGPEELDKFDRRLLSIIQSGFPAVERPFDALAERMGSDSDEVVRRIGRLRAAGMIRRLGAVFDSRRLGYASTLVAARVPPDRLDDVAGTVSRLPGVTHNYRRDHAYNLWFTLTGRSERQLRETVETLKRRTGIAELFLLPALAVYKIRVDFQLGERREVLPAPSADARRSSAQPVTLSERQKDLVRILQEDLPLVARPFSEIGRKLGWTGEAVVEQIRDWLAAGVIRRFGAVVNHHRLGLQANGMVVFRVDPDRVDDAGRRLAERPEISHCFRRPPLPGLDYNLYAMVHARSFDQFRALVAGLAGDPDLGDHEILLSAAEYKKTSMRYFV